MHATNVKTQKIEPDPNFLWWTNVSEAVCKRDWHNVRSYLFFTSQCAMTLTHVRHETWCHLVICFIDTPWRVSMVCTLLWSIASSIFKERPTLGFDCSVYSSVGSFLIGSPYCKLFTGFRLYRLSPSQCCHYVQLLWWPQVLGLSRFIRIDNKLLFVNCSLSLSLSLTHKYMW